MGSNSEIDNLVLYDGVCRFCNNSVIFILDHERNKKLSFAPLQSASGQALLKEAGLPLDYNDSLVFISNNSIYTHSKAALRIAGFLKWPWSWLSLFRVMPSFITDTFYNLIAKHRYLLMGKAEACLVPSPENKHRFLE